MPVAAVADAPRIITPGPKPVEASEHERLIWTSAMTPPSPPGPPPTRVNANGETVPNPAYLYSDHDLQKPPGVPDHAQYVVNIHYRHGETNANSGQPMITPNGNPVPANLHLVNTNGQVVPGAKWFAGNKKDKWVRLTPAAIQSAKRLRPVVRNLMPYTGFIAHSPVWRAVHTMNLATRGIPNLPQKFEKSDLAERGVGSLFGSPKTPAFNALVSNRNYTPPPVRQNPLLPWTQSSDVTGYESEPKFLKRQARMAAELAATNLDEGNGMVFSHQYTIGGIQNAQYRMTGNGQKLGVPKAYMPQYGERKKGADLDRNLSVAAPAGASSVELSNTTGVKVGHALIGAGVPADTRVIAVVGNKVSLSKPLGKKLDAGADVRFSFNPNGFYKPMDAGHEIPNGATLARPGWVWKGGDGKINFVPAQKGYSDLKAP